MLDETFSVSFKHCGYLENGEETKIAPVSNKDCCWIETVMHFRIKLQQRLSTYVGRIYSLDGTPILRGIGVGRIGKGGIRIVNLRYQQTDPTRRGQTGSVQIFTLCAPEIDTIFYKRKIRLEVIEKL